MKVAAYYIIILTLLPELSHAFEANGFISGMSAESALNLLRGRSDRVSELRGGSDVERSYFATFKDRSTTEVITICRGQLHSYQYDVAGGMQAFVRLVQAEQVVSGQGSAEAFSRDTSVGEWSQIKFTWSSGAGQKEVGYSFISSEQVYVRHSMGGGRCQ